MIEIMDSNNRDKGDDQEPPEKRKKLMTMRKSVLSKYFDFSLDENAIKIGVCKACLEGSKIKKIIKMKNSNTTTARDHLQKTHPRLFEELCSLKRCNTSSAAQFQGPSSQKLFEEMLCDWLAEKYLPFSFFDDKRTEELFAFLNPQARLLKRTEMRRKVIDHFNHLRKGVMKILKENNSKISFTIDAWTSIATKSYFGITAHFIDKEWEMHSLTIDFVPSNGEHTGRAIALSFHRILLEYELEDKLQGITVDNASANTTFINELSQIMKGAGQYSRANDIHFRCFAHVLNLAVQDLLKILKLSNDDCENGDSDSETDEPEATPIQNIGDVEFDRSSSFGCKNLCVLQKLRSLIKIIRKSEQWQLKLKACCETTNIEMLSLNIDVCTRWNSTHEMVKTALKMKDACKLLCLNNKELLNFQLVDSEWQILSKIVRFLRDFKILSVTLGGDRYVTLPQVVIGFNMLLDKIEKSMFDANPEISAIDEVFLHALTACRDKIVKHYDKMNWIYCVALILDPRHKTETFDLTDWGKKMKSKSIQEFKQLYRTRYNSFSIEDERVVPSVTNDTDSDDDGIDLNSLFKRKDTRPNCKNEIDNYIKSERAEATTDLLAWWKLHEREFPNLARMARDILSTPATSVPAERLFSKASLTIRKHRNRLTHESAQSLLCLNSWVTCSLAEKIKFESKNCD